MADAWNEKYSHYLEEENLKIGEESRRIAREVYEKRI